MLPKSFFLTMLLVCGVGAKLQRCGALTPSDDQVAAAKVLAKEERASLLAGKRDTKPIRVKTYFHIIAANETVQGGNLSNVTIAAQLAAMNERFLPHNIHFAIAGVDYSLNSTWAFDGGELEMKAALRQGTYADLNLYFEPELSYLGYCYFPDVTDGVKDEQFFIDGCTIRSESVPGGAAEAYDLGLTAVHEIGHWFGLYHTFEGGCDGGDLVADTPAEETEAYGCPIGRDTCTAEGVDPIHNYMDYTDDACYEEFTSGQDARMRSNWNTYRVQFQT